MPEYLVVLLGQIFCHSGHFEAIGLSEKPERGETTESKNVLSDIFTCPTQAAPSKL